MRVSRGENDGGKAVVHLDFAHVDQPALFLRNVHWRWRAGRDVVGVICIRAGSQPHSLGFEDPRGIASMHWSNLATRLVAPSHMRLAFQWGGIEPPVFQHALTKAGQALAFPASLKHWVTVPAGGKWLYFGAKVDVHEGPAPFKIVFESTSGGEAEEL